MTNASLLNRLLYFGNKLKQNNSQIINMILNESEQNCLGRIFFDSTNHNFGFVDVPNSKDLLLLKFFRDSKEVDFLQVIYCPNRANLASHYLKEFINLPIPKNSEYYSIIKISL